jgi:alanine dehydrogenase
VALYLSRADVQQFVSMADAMDVMEQSFARWGEDYAFNLERRRIPRRNGKELNILAGMAPGGDMMGVRASGTQFNNVMMLFSEKEGGLACVMECGPISNYRTGAASGVATKYLARQNSRVLGVIGAGRTAFPQIEAVCVARKIELIKIFVRTEESRVAFAKEVQDALGIKTEAVASGEACMADADIAITSTSAKDPVFFGKWIKPGLHINAIGANNLKRREIDDDTVLRADIVAIDHRAQGHIEAGAIVPLVAVGKIRWDKVSELGEIIQKKRPARTSDDQVTLFHSLGLGFEDVSYGEVIYHRAKAAGLGKQLRD